MRRTLAIAVLLALPWNAAAAQSADFCDFVKTIVAAVPDEFTAYKAKSTVDREGVGHIKGTLAPAGAYECSIYPRAGEKGGIEREPNVSCRFGAAVPFRSEADFAAPNGVYERTAAALRACLPALHFDERIFGDVADPAVNLQRMISVDNDALRVLLQLAITPTATGPAASLGFIVTDHMPPKQ